MVSYNARRPGAALTACRPPNDSRAGIAAAHNERLRLRQELRHTTSPNMPRLEMFARKTRPGWDVWGNEAPTTEAAE